MAEKEPDQVTCPGCSGKNVRVASRRSNYRPRSHTGNLQADLTPVSVTVAYRCQDCGHEWSATTEWLRE
jgi:DNA-directed RNA polymerase subunit RPC12/RpoP